MTEWETLRQGMSALSRLYTGGNAHQRGLRRGREDAEIAIIGEAPVLTRTSRASPSWPGRQTAGRYAEDDRAGPQPPVYHQLR